MTCPECFRQLDEDGNCRCGWRFNAPADDAVDTGPPLSPEESAKAAREAAAYARSLRKPEDAA